jgi:gamma-glutamylcyclotransferase (GGCT)/AIG2-like uncharacterized protein YtfP
MLRVFVYGTLKPGKHNYHRLCRGRVQSTTTAIARGKLYHLPGLGYPAMTPEPGWVRGVILAFPDDTILPKIDDLEDYDPDRDPAENAYNRQEIEVYQLDKTSLGKVWAYYMDPKKVRALGGKLLASGRWE